MAGKDGKGRDVTMEMGPATLLAGKYALGRLIGEGGMGAVYEAMHRDLATGVAVKLLGEGSITYPKTITRF
jgi:serine/threonine protein kinase